TRANITLRSLNMNGRHSQQLGYSPISKWSSIHSVMRDQHIGILAIQESHLNNEYTDDIHKLYSKRLHILNSADPDRPTASAGISFVINREITNTKDLEFTKIIPGRAALLSTKWHKSKRFSILNIYAPNDYTQHPNFWGEIRAFWDTHSLPKPDFMVGDFNLVEDEIDRSPPHADPTPATNALSDTCLALNVVDGWRADHGSKRIFTYQSSSDRLSRIDRIYLQRQHLPCIREWSISSSVVPTDHHLTTFRFSPRDAPLIGPGCWTWPLSLINDDVLLEKVIAKGIDLQKTLTETIRSDTENAQHLWEGYKTAITQIAKLHAKQSLARITSRIRALQRDLSLTHNDPQLDESEHLRTHAALLESEIDHLHKKRFARTQMQGQAHWAANGETPSKYLSR
ncbi:DNase I-like protein, partial [Neolentinus lepideus HHB14362 ss-1]